MGMGLGTLASWGGRRLPGRTTGILTSADGRQKRTERGDRAAGTGIGGIQVTSSRGNGGKMGKTSAPENGSGTMVGSLGDVLLRRTLLDVLLTIVKQAPVTSVVGGASPQTVHGNLLPIGGRITKVVITQMPTTPAIVLGNNKDNGSTIATRTRRETDKSTMTLTTTSLVMLLEAML